jgi:O-antigen ligase
MTAAGRWYSPARPTRDVVVAVGAVILSGAGMALGLGGIAADSVPLKATGGAAALSGIVLLVAGGWIDWLGLVALTLPLPALYDANDIRIAVAAPITAAALLGWALRRAAPAREDDAPRDSRRFMPALALVAMFGVATLFAQNHLLAARETTNFAVLVAFLVAATLDLSREPRRMDRMMMALVLAAGVAGWLALLEGARVIPGRFPIAGGTCYRAAGGFGQPNALGVYLAAVLPLGPFAATRGGARAGRVVLGIATVGIALGLLATFSRGSVLAVLAGLGLVFLAGQRAWVLRVSAVLLPAVAVGAVLADRCSIPTSIEGTLSDWSVQQRGLLQLAGLQMALDHPVTGVGPGNFGIAIDEYGAQLSQLTDFQNTTHNALVQMAAEAGVGGFLAFTAFLGALLLRAYRQARAARSGPTETLGRARALLWATATVSALSLTAWPFSHGPGQAIMLIAACVLAAREPEPT